ncbi:beta-1,6-N-acetylglucosaminyltransferase [Luteolibacter marinus]|uniref:beta-1,6-N-acetylglucosaminyltransferase n=1 Tax=Luteolibacter marinus TaxID=2776705 RepID=UPI0018682CF7|nr:beta-1,6-N-acetylglucosaminyltransferase [Luteolibacter marinus]
MSWTEVFPVFTEDQVDEFEAEATLPERQELEEWYGIARVINPRPECREIVSLSLFWKNVRGGDPDLPVPTRELMMNAVELGLAKRFNPWDHYVKPLLELTPVLLEKFPELSIRVHLASDLEFLADELAGAGCEVHLMKSPSLRFAPGGLWRFLPFEEEGKLVTVTDVDRLNDLEGDLERTRTMEIAGVAAWRVPVPTDTTGDRKVCYLPFMGCQFGVQGGHLEVRRLLDAFTWHARRGTAEHMVIMPNCGPLPIQSHEWPSYGFDEFFMTVAAYPRLAQEGMLTFVPSTARSQLLALDVEYVTWGNPRSELVYFAAGRCCGGPEASPAAGQAPVLGIAEIDADDEDPEPVDPVVGLLYLTRGPVHHPEIWREWVNGDRSRVRHFAHVKHPETLTGGDFLASHRIEERVATEWGGVSLVRATLAMLRAGLEHPDLTHFALVSESCVPVRPLHDLLRSLKYDPRSRLRVTPWEDMRKRDLLKAQRVEKLPGIRKELAHFQDQWMILNRADAEILVADDRTESFEETFAPDECYFATVMAAAGHAPLSHFANRSVTWTDWERSEGHPNQFNKVSPRVAARISESGCFFARKFPAESDIGSYGLHRTRETAVD